MRRRYDKKAMANIARANKLAEQRHIESRSVINEIGPEFAAKAFPAAGNSTPQDGREQRIIDDAAKSLFSKYINNPKANFMMTTERGGEPNRYRLVNVSLTQENVLFDFRNEMDNSASYGDMTLQFSYDVKKDYLSTEGMDELNPFTANFLVGAVNKIREVYYTHMKGEKPTVTNVVDKSDGSNIPDFQNVTQEDPNFNVKSNISKQSFKMFEGKPVNPPMLAQPSQDEIEKGAQDWYDSNKRPEAPTLQQEPNPEYAPDPAIDPRTGRRKASLQQLDNDGNPIPEHMTMEAKEAAMNMNLDGNDSSTPII